jgi:hypothetical protein
VGEETQQREKGILPSELLSSPLNSGSGLLSYSMRHTMRHTDVGCGALPEILSTKIQFRHVSKLPMRFGPLTKLIVQYGYAEEARQRPSR